MIRQLVIPLMIVGTFCSSRLAKAEYIPVVVVAEDAKVFQGTTVVAVVKQNQMLYQTTKKGRWIGVHWEDSDNGQMKRGWIRITNIKVMPKQNASDTVEPSVDVPGGPVADPGGVPPPPPGDVAPVP